MTQSYLQAVATRTSDGQTNPRVVVTTGNDRDPSAEPRARALVVALNQHGGVRAAWASRFEHSASRPATLTRLLAAGDALAALVVDSAGVHLKMRSDASEFRLHGGLGRLRMRNVLSGGSDNLTAVCGLQEGDVFVDATAGQLQDSLAAAAAVGPTGRVVALEASPLIWAVTSGRPVVTGEAEMDRLLNERIEVRLGDHEALLAEMPARSADVVYFDPMFAKPTKASASFEVLRQLAHSERLSASAVQQACRVARRAVIVMDQPHGEEIERLGMRVVSTGQRKRFGIIELSASAGSAAACASRDAQLAPVGETASDEPAAAPSTIHALSSDLLLHVLLHARFDALLGLKAVSRDFASLARRALTRHSKWERARDLCVKLTHGHRVATTVPPPPGPLYAIWRLGGRIALLLDDVPTVEVLLELGVMSADSSGFDQPQAVSPTGQQFGSDHRPLHFARSKAMVDMLVDFGATVDRRRYSGRTPLMDACNHGDVAVVRALCERGANVNLLDSWDGVSGLGADHYARACAERGNKHDQSEQCMLQSTVRGHFNDFVGSSLAQFAAQARALDAYRPPLSTADGTGCARVLREFGIKAAHCSREQLWHASMAGAEVPDEYIVGLH